MTAGRSRRWRMVSRHREICSLLGAWAGSSEWETEGASKDVDSMGLCQL